MKTKPKGLFSFFFFFSFSLTGIDCPKGHINYKINITEVAIAGGNLNNFNLTKGHVRFARTENERKMIFNLEEIKILFCYVAARVFK